MLFPLAGCYLLWHLCFRWLIITYQMEGKYKNLHPQVSWLYISLSWSTARLILRWFLLHCKLLSSSSPFCPTLYSITLPRTSYAEWNTRALPRVNDCSLIGASAGLWWITLLTVLIWVFVGPDCRWLARSAVLELIASLKMQRPECDQRGFSGRAC